MRVVFIFHSSFLVELEKSVLIFDYYGEGRLPKLSKDKDIYFLNSHGHGDHFNRNIWELQKKYPPFQQINKRGKDNAYEKKYKIAHFLQLFYPSVYAVYKTLDPCCNPKYCLLQKPVQFLFCTTHVMPPFPAVSAAVFLH